MAHSATHLVNSAQTKIEEEGGLVNFIRDVGFGGVAYAFIIAIVDGVKDFGTIIFGVPKAVGLGIIGLVETIFLGFEKVAGAGAATAARSFADGLASLLGPLASPVSIGTILLSMGIVIWSFDKLGINPWSIITRG